MTTISRSLSPRRALILSGGAARGAFQVGVLKFLEQRGWRPDLVCGSSVGAIHSAALAAGIDAGQMEALWLSDFRGRLHRLRLGSLLSFGSGPPALLDSDPLRNLLNRIIDFDALRRGPMEVMLSTVDIASSKVITFDRPRITVDHVLASAAAPSVFPWKRIEGKCLWDGGVMANTPILPALEWGAEEIIVVVLSPVAAGTAAPPRTVFGIPELVFEQMLAAPYGAALEGYRIGNGAASCPRIYVVAPSQRLGLFSLINYSRGQVRRLIRDGFRQAQTQLSAIFGK